jgi:hypothetical protein
MLHNSENELIYTCNSFGFGTFALKTVLVLAWAPDLFGNLSFLNKTYPSPPFPSAPVRPPQGRTGRLPPLPPIVAAEQSSCGAATVDLLDVLVGHDSGGQPLTSTGGACSAAADQCRFVRECRRLQAAASWVGDPIYLVGRVSISRCGTCSHQRQRCSTLLVPDLQHEEPEGKAQGNCGLVATPSFARGGRPTRCGASRSHI